jgi:hypothetical protein
MSAPQRPKPAAPSHPAASPPTKHANEEEQPKEQASRSPNREDVHEQREPEQQREGVVRR